MLALGIIFPVFALLENLQSSFALPLIIIWAIASFWIFHSIVFWLTDIRLDFWGPLWYLIGWPITLSIIAVVPLLVLLDTLGISFNLPPALAGIIFWMVVAAIGAWLLQREQRKNKDRLRAAQLINSIHKSGHIIAEEPLPDGCYRYTFSDGRTEYTRKINGQEVLHREVGPALLLEDGSIFYYREGRLDGSPAVRLPDGTTITYKSGYFMGANFAN